MFSIVPYLVSEENESLRSSAAASVVFKDVPYNAPFIFFLNNKQPQF